MTDRTTRDQIDAYAEHSREQLADMLADPVVPWVEKRVLLVHAAAGILRDPDLPRGPDGMVIVADAVQTRTDAQWVQLADRLCPGALHPRPAGL